MPPFGFSAGRLFARISGEIASGARHLSRGVTRLAVVADPTTGFMSYDNGAARIAQGLRSLLSGPRSLRTRQQTIAAGDLVVDNRFVGPSGSPACHLSIARQLPLSCSPRRENGSSELHPV